VKIVLRNDVSGMGRKGDVLDVADGYARNYLLPKGFALVATPGVEAQAEAMRKARQARIAAERAEAAEIAKVLGNTTVRVTAKAGREGKLFGSVSASDIAAAIAAQTGTEVDRRSIDITDAIKTTGSHSVVARLHSEVEVAVIVEVVAQ
jgi:large subunit ribosomal protein L9